MFLVDTNIFVYAADRNAPEHFLCREKVEAWRNRLEPWYTTWPILYEFLRITTHEKVFKRPWPIQQAWEFVEALLASPCLRLLIQTPNHPQIADQTLKEVPNLGGNILYDTHTAILMREHGVHRVVTRDADFRRFSFLEILDPRDL